MSFFFNGFDDDFFGGGGRPKPKKEVNTTRLYEVLGVPKTATQEEIRKAHRKLVRTKHPDKGGDQKEFQEIQQAFDILSNEEKRKVYDTYGEEGIKEGMDASEPTDIFDILRGRSKGGNVKRKTKSTLQQLGVTLEDVYLGKDKYIEVSRYRICKACKGNGAKDPNANTTCSKCDGKGVRMVVQRMGNTILQSQQTCPECRGEGTVIKEDDKCKTCKGNKVTKEKKQLKVSLDKGAMSGKRYTFEGESDEVPGYEPGDVVIEIELKPHAKFERKGADLWYTMDITLLEALTGFNQVVEHLDGRKILIKSSPGEIISPTTIKKVSECGMPFYDNPVRFGNLNIKFNVMFPKSLNNEQKVALEKLFPPQKSKIDISKIAEKYTLEEYSEKEAKNNEKGGLGLDEEDEESSGRGGAHQVRCENQ